jgi:hypothetical protein
LNLTILRCLWYFYFSLDDWFCYMCVYADEHVDFLLKEFVHIYLLCLNMIFLALLCFLFVFMRLK